MKLKHALHQDTFQQQTKKARPKISFHNHRCSKPSTSSPSKWTFRTFSKI